MPYLCDKGYKLSKNWSWIKNFSLILRAVGFIGYFLSGKKRKKAGNFPAFFCELFGYFWKIFWTIVVKNVLLFTIGFTDGYLPC